MPIQRCERNNEQGWQWGDSGKCYLVSEEGTDKKAKQKAYIQGYAIGELSIEELKDMSIEVTELATIVDVPIIHAGTFYPHNSELAFEVEEDELDEIIEGSTKLQPIIKEAIETGIYRGNEELSSKLSKPIPGLINIKHQQPFPSQDLSEKFNSWVKDAVQGVSVSFHKQLIDGKTWVVKRFENVRNDVAATLQQQYPLRSSEFIGLTDPDTGRYYPKVERSTAFLDILTPPAVGGQTPELVVEFAAKDEPLVTITTQGVNIMAEPKQEKAVDVAELQKMQATLTELQAKVATFEDERNKAIELAEQEAAEKKRLEKEVSELRQKDNVRDAKEALTHFARMRSRGGRVLTVSPAFLEVVKPHIENNGVIELQEGQSQKEAFSDMLESIAELAAKETLLIDVTPAKKEEYSPTEEEPKSITEQIRELMAADEKLEYKDAWVQVTSAKEGN